MMCVGEQPLFAFNQSTNHHNPSYWATWCLFTQRHVAQEKNSLCILKSDTQIINGSGELAIEELQQASQSAVEYRQTKHSCIFL